MSVFRDKIIEPVRKFVRENSTTPKDYFNLVFFGIGVMGVLILFLFLFYQIGVGFFGAPRTFEDWEYECKQQGFSIDTGMATYIGTYHHAGITYACCLIQSNEGEKIYIDRFEHYLMPHDWNGRSYLGLSFPIKYAKDNPNMNWLFYEQPIHDEKPPHITYGTIEGVTNIYKILIRVRLSIEIETSDGKMKVTEQQYLPLKYLKLCKKLKREKSKIPIGIYSYTLSEDMENDLEYLYRTVPRSSSLLPNFPKFGYIVGHPWIACIMMDSIKNYE